MLLPDEQGLYRTQLGAMLSILTLLLVIIYGSFKMSTLVNMYDYSVQVRSVGGYFEETQKFHARNGLMFAAGLSTFSDQTEVEEDPSIGVIRFYWKRWSQLNVVT